MDKLKIGITGHRDLREEDIDELNKLLNEEIGALQEAYPEKQLQMLNALAAGADRLAAEYAIKSDIDLVAVLPFSPEFYEKDFVAFDCAEFKKQLAKASEIITSYDMDSQPMCNDDGYRRAGRYIADNCDYLIAFWDGVPGTEEGCGTGDIVKYFVNKKPERLIHIKTRRRDKRPLTDIQDEADEQSIINQKRYMGCLKLLSLMGVLLVFTFLCYDNLGINKMIFFYGGLIAISSLILYIAGKKKYHDNYVNQRLLAEVLRVQNVLDKAEINKNATTYLPRTVKEETNWISKIIEKGIHDDPVDDLNILKAIWLEDQYKYQIKARQRTEERMKANNIISTTVLIATIGVIIWACVMEVIPIWNVNTDADAYTIKNIILITVGILSAASVFLSGYYGKQNLERKCHDHAKMSTFYEEALARNEGMKLTKESIENIAREEILENSNWYSYMKESKLTIEF